ncbi:MAG: hypothetical protein LKM33_01260 [Bacteroidales bacterium]|jgi:hypothetical protein|nr:hypothetical protein [Bacteroidales bacterium]
MKKTKAKSVKGCRSRKPLVMPLRENEVEKLLKFKKLSEKTENRIEDLLEKYCCQREHVHYVPDTVDDDDEDFTREELIELNKYGRWINNRKPTGIKSDEEFYELQKKIYGKVILRIEE